MKYIGICLLLLLGYTQGHGQGRHPKLLEAAVHGKYKPGSYTLLDGTRHTGKLRIWQTLTQNLLQVDQGKADPLNLPPEQLRHFTMGVDSFIVARAVAVAGYPTTMPFGAIDIYRVVLKGKLEVLEHDQLVPGQGASYGPSHALAWVLCPGKAADLVIVPTENDAFTRHMAPFFIDFPTLSQRIRAGLVGPNDFKRIVYAYIFRKEISQVSYQDAATLFQ